MKVKQRKNCDKLRNVKMSHSLPVAPVPPPSPPAPTLCNFGKTNTATTCIVPKTATKLQIDECLWALDYPELQKSCYLARICTNQAPRRCQYNDIAGILQVGPTCGLVAISMFLNGKPTPKQLLDCAKQLFYTNNGEMFSAQNMFQLILDNLHALNNNNSYEVTQASNFKCQMHKGLLNCAIIKDNLLAGSCLFVPYDPDFNHAPCLKYGHKAHWALIVGYLISDNDEFYVLARHGKAKNLAVWSLTALSESNANLIEFAQPKGYPDCDFLLPPGGIGGDLGLRERAIIVAGLTHKVITVR